MPRYFGIDLGTTYSAIAYVADHGFAEMVKTSDNETTSPSVVYFAGPNLQIVGKEAKARAQAEPGNVVEMVKREIGEAGWAFSHAGQSYSAEEISASILRKLVSDAGDSLGEPVTDVVITVPAYFAANERNATKHAGEIAGLTVHYILSEPLAAAIAYGVRQDENQTVLVYDLGGGTFDVTVLQIASGRFQQVATGGDRRLGGHDWDAAIVEYLRQQILAEHPELSDPKGDPETWQDLWLKAEEAKKALTRRAQAARSNPDVAVETMIRVSHGGEPINLVLDLETFDSLTESLLEDTVRHTRSTLAAAAAKGVASFDKLLLVGGSSRMPQVVRRLRDEFGVEPQLYDPDEAVAKGAGIFAASMQRAQGLKKLLEEYGVEDWNDLTEDVREQRGSIQGSGPAPAIEVEIVTSHSFGVVVAERDSDEEFVANLIRLNSPLPHSVTQQFGTRMMNQSRADIRVMENILDQERVDLEFATEIGNAQLTLPPGLPAGAPIEITFTLDDQGLLQAHAKELTGGQQVACTIQTGRNMTAEQVAAAKVRAAGITVT